MPVEQAPEDDDVRQSYNFAPGYHGLIYRADVPDIKDETSQNADVEAHPSEDVKYKLQAMQWGKTPMENQLRYD